MHRLMLAYGADSLDALATSSGHPIGTLRTWHKRGAVPPGECVRVAHETGVSLDWLMLGRYADVHPSPVFFGPDGSLVNLPDQIDPARRSDVVNLKKYDAVGSCGCGSWLEHATVIETVPFARAGLVREGLSPDHTVIIGTRGDSMAPLIRPGAEVLVDCSKRDPRTGGVFAFTWQGELMIKYLQLTDQGLRMSSENSERFSPRLFSPFETEQIVVEGRVYVQITRL